MSYGFRERLKEAIAKDLRERLHLTQDEIDWIKENIMKICPISDEMAIALKKYESRFRGKSLDQIIDMMTKEEFEDFVREVLEEAKKRLNYKKKEKKKKQQESDSDSDTDGSEEPIKEEQEQTEQVREEKNE